VIIWCSGRDMQTRFMSGARGHPELERWRSDLTHVGGRGAEQIGEAIVAAALAESGNL
jgi:hypothetical protein